MAHNNFLASWHYFISNAVMSKNFKKKLFSPTYPNIFTHVTPTSTFIFLGLVTMVLSVTVWPQFTSVTDRRTDDWTLRGRRNRPIPPPQLPPAAAPAPAAAASWICIMQINRQTDRINQNLSPASKVFAEQTLWWQYVNHTPYGRTMM